MLLRPLDWSLMVPARPPTHVNPPNLGSQMLRLQRGAATLTSGKVCKNRGAKFYFLKKITCNRIPRTGEALGTSF